MKTVNVLFSLLILLTFFAFTAKKSDDACLRVSGIATQDGILIEEATAKLFLGNQEVATVKTGKKNKGFEFLLKRNAYYAIEVSTPGCVPRLLVISTQLPKNVSADPLFSFEFEIDLFPETARLNDEFLDFPVAIVAFDKVKKTFDYKKKYTSHIKNKISEPNEVAPVVQR